MKTKAKKERKPIRQVSAKREKKLAAKGVKLFGSTIAPSSKPKKKAGAMGAMPQRVTKPRKAIAKVGKQKAKREARNREYYASPEWRAKRAAAFERDGYQCVERAPVFESDVERGGNASRIVGEVRCPNRGEVVNGKQTSRGLVGEETGYQHRGVEGLIDRIKTRCKDCDRRLTPLERINHAYGFRSAQS